MDILFKRQRLILEINGWETHGTRLAFEEDRRRPNHLVLAGYAVLNFTYQQLVTTLSGLWTVFAEPRAENRLPVNRHAAESSP